MNEDNPQQDNSVSSQPNQSAPSLSGGKKVIQPLDPNLKIESPISPVATAQPTATQPTQKPTSAAPQQSPPPTSSIYPNATSGVGTANQPTSTAGGNFNQSTPSADGASATTSDNKRLIIIILVIALGIYTAAPAVLRLVGAGKLISLGFVSSGSVFITILDIIYLVIGIGLVLRREIARAAYVFFAVIFLLLALYGTFKVYSQQHSQSTPQGNLRVQLQYDISYCLTKPPSAQRSQIVQQLENDVNNNQQPTQTCSSSVAGVSNQYVALIPSYLLAIIPLVFLTRPIVKEVFS